MDNIISRFRSEILNMEAYKSARSLYEGSQDIVFLDANECAFEPYVGALGLSRYASQQPKLMIDKLCRLYDVSSRHLMVTRGADESIDILIRSICVPGKDNIIICPPTFPMYQQGAMIQNIQVKLAPLQGADFSLDLKAIDNAVDDHTKIIFLCTPNNPTGNLIPVDMIREICVKYRGKVLIVVDETYIEFANAESLVKDIDIYPNLIVLRTLSKAYAAAGLRCGVTIAQADIISVLKKVLAPYPVPQPVVKEVLTILSGKNIKKLSEKRQEILDIKKKFIQDIAIIPSVKKIYPSCTNFVCVEFDNAEYVYNMCKSAGFILRDQSSQPGLQNCIRISMGTAEQMDRLIAILKGDEMKLCANERRAVIVRKTNETSIHVEINLDRTAPIQIKTGIGFYDHMLEQIAKHGQFSLLLECEGDLDIDQHHTIEDCAIALGAVLKDALGDKRGIGRYGFVVPMDESEASCSIDLSNRFFLKFEGAFDKNFVGDLPTDMVEHVFRSLAENLGATVHVSVTGQNTHHMVEACFKAFGRCLSQAISMQKNSTDLPSSKGVL